MNEGGNTVTRRIAEARTVATAAVREETRPVLDQAAVLPAGQPGVTQGRLGTRQYESEHRQVVTKPHDLGGVGEAVVCQRVR